MASFDIGTAAKIIPEFDGNKKKLSNFLGMIEFYASTIATLSHNTLLNFVLTTKLSDSVKNRLLVETKPETLAQLSEILKSNFKASGNPNQIHMELSKTQQGSFHLAKYISRIEYLIAQLNEIQIAENGQESRATIIKINDQLALNTFKNGLHYSLKNTVIAARPETFKDAVAVALEIQKQTSNAHVVRHYGSNYSRQQNNYNNNNHTSNYRQNNYNRNNNTNNGRNNNQKNNKYNNNYRPNHNSDNYQSRNRNQNEYNAQSNVQNQGN